jgi:hypothetical protein
MAISNEQFVDFLKKNPISVGCAILSLALVGVYYFRKDLGAEAATELEEKSTEAARLAANKKNAEQIKEHLESIIAAEKQIEARLIRPKDIAANTQYFYQLESDTGVKLLDSRAAGQTPKKDTKQAYLPVPFVVSVQGGYSQILTFLQHLENGRHYCRVLTASCMPSGPERNSPLTLSLSLELLGTPVP